MQDWNMTWIKIILSQMGHEHAKRRTVSWDFSRQNRNGNYLFGRQRNYMIEMFIQLWSIENIGDKNEIYMYSDSYEKLEKCYESMKVL